MATQQSPTTPAPRARLSAAQQFERVVLVIVLLGLILTGVPQTNPTTGWAHSLFVLGGGIESMRILHRFFALLLFVEILYHILSVGYNWFVRRVPFALWPGASAFRALFRRIRLNFGGPEPEARPDYRLVFKFEWLVIAFSVIVLALTGLVLWNPIAATGVLPAAAIPTSLTIHSSQAVMLVLLLVLLRIGILALWRPNRASLYAEYEAKADPQADRVRHRRRIYLPVALIVAGLVAVVLGSFLTSEQTAIDTVPRREAVIFAPDAVPDEGDPHIGEVLWGTLRCSFCHGPQGAGGPNGEPAIRRPDLTFEAFYQQVRTGLGDMPAFGAEDLPDGYMVHLWSYLTQGTPAAEATEAPSDG